MLLFFLIQNINAQIWEKPLSYNEMVKLDKSLKGSVIYYLFLWIDGYYSADLEFNTSIDELFDFSKDDAMLVPVKIQQILQNNKQSFQLEKTDSTLTIYYDGQFIICLQNSFTCESISERSSRRNMVRIYDEKGVSIWNEQLVKTFQEEIIEIYKKYREEEYETVFFPNDTMYIAASNQPLIIVYQYNKKQGLSIHKLCACKYELLRNSYIKDLAELANKYCEKYNLNKIIFAARVLRSKDE